MRHPEEAEMAALKRVAVAAANVVDSRSKCPVFGPYSDVATIPLDELETALRGVSYLRGDALADLDKESPARPANRGAALLAEFGQAQQEKLTARAAKGDWHQTPVSDLWEAMLHEIRDELFPVVDEILEQTGGGRKPLLPEEGQRLMAALRDETVDVGTYAAIIYDVLRGQIDRAVALYPPEHEGAGGHV